jgi:hypothetical protein
VTIPGDYWQLRKVLSGNRLPLILLSCFFSSFNLEQEHFLWPKSSKTRITGRFKKKRLSVSGHSKTTRRDSLGSVGSLGSLSTRKVDRRRLSVTEIGGETDERQGIGIQPEVA